MDPSVNSLRGYGGPGDEVLDEKNKGNEKKETFDLGHPDGPDEMRYYPKNDSFIQISGKMYSKFFEVYKKVMVALEKGLKL